MIKYFPVTKIIMPRAICDNCGRDMKCDMVLTSYPPQYQYRCPECGATETSFVNSGELQYILGEESE